MAVVEQAVEHGAEVGFAIIPSAIDGDARQVRRILHYNVTGHPTAEWAMQQFREIPADPHPYRFVLHDRDAIFSTSLDLALRNFGVRVLKTPVRTPKANAFCERLVG